MTGIFEQPKHTGPSAAWPGASTTLVQADDILTPEELAARLKVPDSWAYEKTRGRCRNPIPCLCLGRYVRFNWVPLWFAYSGNMADRPRAPGNPSGRAEASPETAETGPPGLTKTGLIEGDADQPCSIEPSRLQ